MKQLTLAAVGFERYAKTTRRATFLAEMERVVPWPALCALIYINVTLRDRRKDCVRQDQEHANGPSHHWQEGKVPWLSISGACGAFRPDRRSVVQSLLDALRAA